DVADRDALGTKAAGDGGEIGVWKNDIGHGFTGEVVDFSPVGCVVIHEHNQGDLVPNGGFELLDSHQESTVTGAQHWEPIGLCEGGSDGGIQSEPNGLEGLGETETELVGYVEILRWVAHEVP